MSEDKNENYVLSVAFTDQSPNFAFGVAFGMLFEKMETTTETTIETCTNFENREVICRAADYLGWDISIKESEVEGWDHLVATKKPKQAKHLTIVK